MQVTGLARYCSFLLYNLGVYLFVYYLSISNSWDIYKDWLFNDIQNNEVYEYIIVGAGTAGSVLGSRLLENGHKILLIEAGGMPPFFLNIPVITPALQESVYDWRYVTTPQIHACKGLINNQSIWPRGKIFGGTSRLNYMIYVRGHPQDFEEWFPDFRESIFEDEVLSIDDLRWSSKLVKGVLEGVSEMGHPVQDINKGHSTGFMKAKVFMKNGERWSSDRIFENRNKNKLSIITNAHVNKVLFESKKAVGIEFSKLNKRYKALATKGVILSAGAIGTPKILMLSGIGPKKHLEDLKIEVVSNLPVGQNLMDHVITGLDLVILNSSQPISIADVLNPLSMLEYFFYHKGLWNFNGVDVIGTYHSSLQKNKSAAPDLELMVMPLGVSQDNGFAWRKAMGISDQVFKEYFAPLSYQNAVTLAPVLLHPKSLGEIKLRSKNPLDSPIIDPNYLSNKDDIRTLIDGIQFVKKLLDTEAMKKLGATLYRKPFPGCEEKIFDSEDYWECYVRHLTLTCYHPAGTSRMGEVVDKSFRVYNMKNLYVVDASLFPVLPSGNINAAVIMLAEKAAKLFQQSKQNSLSQFSLKCSIFDIFLFRTIIQNTAELTTELNFKREDNWYFISNDSNTEELIKSTYYNFFLLEPTNIPMQPSKSYRHKRQKSPRLIREIYEPGHSVSLSDKCSNRGLKLKLFIPILSDPWHYTARKAIRETWGIFGRRKDVKILFFLGSTTNGYLEIKLIHEQRIFNDIVRCNIYDSYTNLTLKMISVLEWVDIYCSKAKYILKTDDDVFINMPRLLTFVRLRLKLKDVIFGKISQNNKPHRDKENKYYVPILQYKLPKFPPFVTGPAYLLSGDTVHRLYTESLNTPFLKLEDVFLTGIVAEKLGITRIDRSEFVNQRISFSICELQRSLSLHSIKSSEQYDLWERLFDCNPNCPYFCLHKSSTAILVKNNFILSAITVCTASLFL